MTQVGLVFSNDGSDTSMKVVKGFDIAAKEILGSQAKAEPAEGQDPAITHLNNVRIYVSAPQDVSEADIERVCHHPSVAEARNIRYAASGKLVPAHH